MANLLIVDDEQGIRQLLTLVFALIYKMIPRVHVSWRDVWVGAGVTALLFTIGKFLIGLYIGKSSVASSFGAAGPFVIVMVWIYYSTQVFLLGAEFTVARARRRNPELAKERRHAHTPDRRHSAVPPGVPAKSAG